MEGSATNNTSANSYTHSWWDAGRIQIPLYSIIFLLAVIGNSLVILTLVVHQRMRTITNVFLLNLAVSDLLLGVLCMPFTLIGALLRDFVFGDAMCRIIPYLQACSVAVNAWTLVAISVERYYAICHPLRSRRWQTLSHAYNMIVMIWGGSLTCMGPIAALSELKPTNQGHHKCREGWSDPDYERGYNILLDILLLVLPLVVLAVAYSLITRTLYQGSYGNGQAAMIMIAPTQRLRDTCRACADAPELPFPPHTCGRQGHAHHLPIGLRRSNAEKSLRKKKRVIKMLCAVVLEFFICWTPLYVINTIALFTPGIVYDNLGYNAIGFFQLLAYTSSCCNPITYCFMNSSFRKSFMTLFRCRRRFSSNHSDASVSDGTLPRSLRWVQDARVYEEHL